MKNRIEKFSKFGGVGLPVPRTFRSVANVTGKFIDYSGNGVGFESPNTYPQVLAELASNSPTHGRALALKAKLTFGQGLDLETQELPNELLEFLLEINDSNQSINDILERISLDLITYGGMSLIVNWNFNRTIRSIEHVPFKNVRLGMPVEGQINDYIVSNDWEMKLPSQLRTNYRINNFNPDLIQPQTITVNGDMEQDEETLLNSRQLVYFKTYNNSDTGFYPVPDYIHVLDSAFTEVETGITMLKSIVNGINGAYIVITPDTIVDDEDKQEEVDVFADLVTGSENAGGIIRLTGDPDQLRIEKVEAIPADTYTEVNQEIRQRLITGHGIPAILLEYNFGGGFNNRAEEMQVAIQQFQDISIKSYQNQILRYLNPLMGYVTAQDFSLSIVPFLSVDEDSTAEGSGNTTNNSNDVDITDETSLDNSDNQ